MFPTERNRNSAPIPIRALIVRLADATITPVRCFCSSRCVRCFCCYCCFSIARLCSPSFTLSRRASSAPHPERGAGHLTLIVFGLLFAAAAYYAYYVIPFFFSYYELQNEMQAKIRVAGFESDDKIRKHLLKRIAKMEIPARAEDLKIARVNDYMFIEVKYREIFYVTFRGKDYDLQTFDFDCRAEGPFDTSRDSRHED